jgi:hypothetical protein
VPESGALETACHLHTVAVQTLSISAIAVDEHSFCGTLGHPAGPT